MKTVTKYEASSLEEIAAHFDTLAAERAALSSRTPGKARSAVQSAKAETWRAAAALLRDIRLVTGTPTPPPRVDLLASPRTIAIASAFAVSHGKAYQEVCRIVNRVGGSHGWPGFWMRATEDDVLAVERALGLQP